ncbi:MAG: NAD(P)-dependent oxidoreductase [Ignavibacteriales bacterium UTCHB2]|jgi:dTDP-4-dehydrorhamnose reductase|nr:MAG: dTDP-4-dehydrorhamnose reductase [Ignavibacteria bacterium ADurb.Bin266]OQY71264.1 MAG: NAD(P)-dependent oxidoreductase [Ignavibacteriales bacterium UTCHB2]HQI42327.1 NAD(P)-dependent oxidoreductase [Ignavibacteriaceae bacterium]HQJ45893.1 NAD(P)-dependent oxidoreductase [Ignavibacteriaceae bacterium]
MKILITGGGGSLGQYLNIQLSKQHNIFTIYNSNAGNCREFNSGKVNILIYDELKSVFETQRPDVVIHTAAITSTIPNKNISSKLFYDLNVNATARIAELCDLYKAKLIYTSTDLVYAGYSGSMLTESAKLIPVSLYAETKLMGEVKIQQTFDNYIILRTALLFGIGLNHSQNHFHKMLNDLKDKKEVKLFTDQYRTPLSLKEAARMINDLLNNNIKSEVINFGGPERVSRYELGERLCELFKLDKNLLVKIIMDEVPALPKVEDVSMNTDKLKSFGIKQNSLDKMILEV